MTPLQQQVLAALLALLAVTVPASWRITRHVVTIAHEGAHGVVAAVCGRRLAGIRLHRDGSGLTVSRGRPTGPGMIATALAGYIGPALLGLGAATLVQADLVGEALWLAVVLLGLLLLQIRNLHGWWAVLLAGAAVFAVTWWGSITVQLWAASVGTWFLLLATPRTVVELQRLRHRGRAPGSDADVLARLTRVPGLVWVGVFVLVDLAALGLGGRLLLSG
ncbi:M50 family peptidase [Nocardioides mangrovicus]|uniref:M50 family peptidase n=1 Tax=Nocardioides mangrovicus TaxID=2478913 RepID=A0A3L8P4M1_9ACTN|nr:M50 family metallopeptidase [Nocardioides mangrovicus]RLV50054.1 M50 family peptidase [Nocardioides mangrovicus]